MEIKIKKIIILEGGYNEEHKVSLKTSKEIKKVLKKFKINFESLLVNPKKFSSVIKKYKKCLCFNALHGPFGEDGEIQKILRQNNIKFTHSGINSSKLCFDKYRAKKIITKNKILTPKFIKMKKRDLNVKSLKNIKNKFIKFVIKPNKSGSSFGVNIIRSKKDYIKFENNLVNFKNDLSKHDTILIEQFISGKELTVSTIDFNNKIEALAVTEIKPKNYFFDYKSKYSKGYSNNILPAKISKNNYKNCLKLAEKVHKIFGCNSIARTDFILNKEDNKIYFLETNTQPGMTPISLLPAQAKFKNITFDNIIISMIKKLNE